MAKQKTIAEMLAGIKKQVIKQKLEPSIDKIAKSVVKKARTNNQLWTDYLMSKVGGSAKKRILGEFKKRQDVERVVGEYDYFKTKEIQNKKTLAEPLGEALQQIRDQYTQHIKEQGNGSSEYTWLYGPNYNGAASSVYPAPRLSWVNDFGFAHYGDQMGIVVRFRESDNSPGFSCIYPNTSLEEYHTFASRSPKGKSVWAMLYYRDYIPLTWHD